MKCSLDALITCRCCQREAPCKPILERWISKYALSIDRRECRDKDGWHYDVELFDVPIQLIRALRCTKCGAKDAMIFLTETQLGLVSPWEVSEEAEEVFRQRQAEDGGAQSVEEVDW
jgi:hypothetical protein